MGLDHAAFTNNKERRPIEWRPNDLTNCHVAIVGTSGAGKTTWLRKFIASVPEDVIVSVLDYHGDIDLDLPSCRTVMFSEQTKYGFNPLRINCDIHYGGVRRAIQDVINAFNEGQKLGVKQEGLIRHLLLEAYAERGIEPDKPNTWQRRVGTTAEIEEVRKNGVEGGMKVFYPTLTDVLEAAQRRLFSAYSLISENDEGVSAVGAYAHFRKYASQHHRLLSSITKNGATKEDIKNLEDLRSNCAVTYRDYLDSVSTGYEFEEATLYSDKNVIMSVINRLQKLVHTGLFEPNPPPFGNARIRRYFLRPLAQSPDELKMFIRLRLQAIIRQMMQDGHTDGRLRHVIVLDESKPFNSDDEDNPINVIATQMRKFGLGLVQAGQTPSHMSDEFRKNAATLLVLNLAPEDWDDAARTIKVPKDVLRHLRPHELAAIRMMPRSGPVRFRGLIIKEGVV